MAVLIYLLRHGETVYNAQRRYQGAQDVPLSAQGRRLRPAGVELPAVYVSPLTRAAESAALLFPRARLIPVEGLQEMHFGAFEGRSAQEMEDDPAYRAWVEGDCLGRCPGGESRAEFSDRCCAAFSRLVDEELRKGSPRMAVVAHGGTQMAVLERFGAPGRAYYAWCTPNGGGYVLRADRWASEKKLDLVQEVCFAEGSPWKS